MSYHKFSFRKKISFSRKKTAALIVSCIAAVGAGAGAYLITAPDAVPVLAGEASIAVDAETYSVQQDSFGWQKDEEGWYYLQDGKPAQGLLRIDEKTYYFIDGRPQYGFIQFELGYRYFDAENSGAMTEGLFQTENGWYFAGEDGVLLHGFVETEEGREYFDESGRRASGMTRIGGKMALLDENGRPAVGWEKAFDGIYCRDADGIPLTGEQEIDGTPYFFDSFGRLETGFVRTDEGTRYYTSEGVMAVGSLTLGGAEYEFTEDGIMKGNVSLSVPVIMQNPALPNGCEITSLAEVLQFEGFSVSHTELAESYLPCGKIRYENGKTMVPDPEEEYVGDPSTNSGWYCFEGPVMEAANRYLSEQNSTLRAVKISGESVKQLEEYIQQGKPVIVWVTQKLADIRRTAFTWTLPDGSEVHPYGGLHCVVLSGMDENTVTFADPIYGEWTAEKERFEEIFEGMGSRAVVIE